MMNLPTQYHYLVRESLQTTNRDRHFSHVQPFINGTLTENRKKAIEYAQSREDGIELRNHFYNMPLTQRGDLSPNMATYSVSAFLIEKHPVHGIYEHAIYGEDVDTMRESWELERSLGITP